ncbi:MAG: tetratricopeptide repeat protein [Thermodesulfobacteriota bacterium]|nr:tetratricopeptide repeat protein [Thermodesulfobacteriota bacterium]
MYLYLGARTAERRGKKTFFFILCSISFVLAFGSKENAAMLPVSLFLYEILVIQENTYSFLRKNLKWILLFLGIILLSGLIYLSYTGGGIFSFRSGYRERSFSMMQRLLTEPRVILFYISLLVYPVANRLSIAHSISISTSLFHPVSTFLSILLILGSVAYLAYGARKHPLISFCFLFFFLNHLIESTIFPLELIYEHRNYIPSMLFFVPVAIGLIHLVELYSTKTIIKYSISVFIVLILISFGHSTFVRNFIWKNGISLWIDASEKAPDQFRVHHNLGLYYQDHGDNEKAITEYEKALKSPFIYMKNAVVKTYCNLGNLYEGLKDYKKAKFYYKKALQIKPDLHLAFNGLASIYYKEGENDLADRYLHRALKANPGDLRANYNMGLYLLKNRMPGKAIRHLIAVISSKGLENKTLLYLGIAYKQMGLNGRAVTYFREAKIMDPKNLTPHLHLAEIYYKTGNGRMAQKEMDAIVDLMVKDKALFYQIVDLILKKGNLGHIQLSQKIIFPLLLETVSDKSKILNKCEEYVKEVMGKEVRDK